MSEKSDKLLGEWEKSEDEEFFMKKMGQCKDIYKLKNKVYKQFLVIIGIDDYTKKLDEDSFYGQFLKDIIFSTEDLILKQVSEKFGINKTDLFVVLSDDSFKLDKKTSALLNKKIVS